MMEGYNRHNPKNSRLWPCALDSRQEPDCTMPQRFLAVLLAAALIAALFPCRCVAAGRSELMPEPTANRLGLTRPWFTQVVLDPGRGQTPKSCLAYGTIYAQTDRGVIQAIDAETGKTLWWKQVGNPDYPTTTPGVNHELLAVLNGSQLYVLNRATGEVLDQKQLAGVPGAGPALSEQRAYVPTTTGMLMAYRLDSSAEPERKANQPLDEAGKSNAVSGSDTTATTPVETAGRKDVRDCAKCARRCFANPTAAAWCSPWLSRKTAARNT